MGGEKNATTYVAVNVSDDVSGTEVIIGTSVSEKVDVLESGIVIVERGGSSVTTVDIDEDCVDISVVVDALETSVVFGSDVDGVNVEELGMSVGAVMVDALVTSEGDIGGFTEFRVDVIEKVGVLVSTLNRDDVLREGVKGGTVYEIVEVEVRKVIGTGRVKVDVAGAVVTSADVSEVIKRDVTVGLKVVNI